MSYLLSPFFNEPQVDANGDPVAGGQIETYLSGTLTPTVTYKTSSGTAHTNPIILDAAGYYPTGTQLYLENGRVYKFIFKDAVGATLRTIDNVTAINDVISSPSEWVQYGLSAFSYLSANSFSVVGDQTGIFQVGRRIQTTNTGGTAYGSVLTAVYGSPNTTVTLTNTSGSLDSGLSAVFYSLISTVNSSLPAYPIASEVLAGIVELATNAEAIAGVDSTRAITPASMKAAQIVLGTAVSATGSAIDFTGIPTWADRITILASGVSTNSTNGFAIQAGTSGGIVSTGYNTINSGLSATIVGSSGITSAFITLGTSSAATLVYGACTIERISGNIWVSRSTFYRSGDTVQVISTGQVSLGAAMDRIRVSTVDTFDAGTLNISWE